MKPKKKVVEGSVDAHAGAAEVALNQVGRPTESIAVEGQTEQTGALPPPFYFREVSHVRVKHVLSPEGMVREGQTLVERVSEGGEWPQDLSRFHGIGALQFQTPQGPKRQEYRFEVPAVNLEQAWANFDDASTRGAAQAVADFRAQMASLMRSQQGGLVVPAPGAASRLLGTDGKVLR